MEQAGSAPGGGVVAGQEGSGPGVRSGKKPWVSGQYSVEASHRLHGTPEAGPLKNINGKQLKIDFWTGCIYKINNRFSQKSKFPRSKFYCCNKS